jgi:hypothetical protein
MGISGDLSGEVKSDEKNTFNDKMPVNPTARENKMDISSARQLSALLSVGRSVCLMGEKCPNEQIGRRLPE